MTETGFDLFALWAKSGREGLPHSLPGHLLDAAAIAELIWDFFLPSSFCVQFDESTGGQGRAYLVLMAGWHDLGKASPGFQGQVRHLADRAEARGWPMATSAVRDPHQLVSHHIARVALLGIDGGLRWAATWVPPILHGHHGTFVAPSPLSRTTKGPPWREGQLRLASWVRQQVLREALRDTPGLPSMALQLEAAGFVSMADWIASSSLFPGRGDEEMTMNDARDRAAEAWGRLGLVRGWSCRSLGEPVGFAARFGFPARPLQAQVVEAAERLSEPGLLLVEAPMGEGKTEAAMAATEVLARRLDVSGFVFAMPTQGTTDAMFARVLSWSRSVDAELPVALLHGKAMINEAWRRLIAPADLGDICDNELGDPYGSRWEPARSNAVPSEWLRGRHRGLLCPGSVATIDQLLVAGSMTKYVALRHAGLAGKVLIIDEVHSYDVFMASYLHQLLRWCANARIPVVLMSATLPPKIREALIAAYRDGSLGGVQTGPQAVLRPDARSEYPRVTTWSPRDGMTVRRTESSRPRLGVSVEVARGPVWSEPGAVVDRATDACEDGGCVLVIVNTVRRAQQVYAALKSLGVPARLLHGRLTTSARAERTDELLRCLGPTTGRGSGRPERLVVVATQIAEQSFDVDADLLITDLAPIDLLLQRIGRVHRHARPERDRPASKRQPRVIVTGCDLEGVAAPAFVKSFEYVYDRWSLLRAAQLLDDGHVTWQLPEDVPRLVAAGYDEDAPWPDAWSGKAKDALEAMKARSQSREAAANLGVLRLPLGGNLEGLHDRPVSVKDRIAVRDGEPTHEVVLVKRIGDVYVTLAGRPLGQTGERASREEIALGLLGDTVRVRESEWLGDLAPLPGWTGVPLLARQDALVLDEDGQVSGDWGSARYDLETGLSITRAYGKPRQTG